MTTAGDIHRDNMRELDEEAAKLETSECRRLRERAEAAERQSTQRLADTLSWQAAYCWAGLLAIITTAAAVTFAILYFTK